MADTHDGNSETVERGTQTDKYTSSAKPWRAEAEVDRWLQIGFEQSSHWAICRFAHTLHGARQLGVLDGHVMHGAGTTAESPLQAGVGTPMSEEA